MEKYEPMGVVGEGSYGIVLKCKSRHDGKVVAIKKFIDSEDDVNVRKIALREIRVLKKLRHENLVSLIEVFRRRKHLYLVFEFIDHTLLDQMEQKSHGLDEETCRKYIFQILRGLGFCHDNSVIHRDIKPENVLVSKNGIVKLCDFGFARNLSGPGDIYTDYVATRWYRAPELLVGDVAYGKEVDIWAVGCLFAEMMTGEPLFPGDSDIDQLFLIAQCLGRLSKRHLNIMSKNSAFRGFQFPKSRHGSTTSVGSSKFSSKLNEGNAKSGRHSGAYSSHMNSSSGRSRNNEPAPEPVRSVFSVLFPAWSEETVYFLTVCLDPEPNARPTCNSLMRMPYFAHDNFPTRFIAELNSKLQLEGRQTTASHLVVRKRRSLVPTGNVGAVFPGSRTNVTSTVITPSERSIIFPNSRNASIDDGPSKQLHHSSFQSNNLSNQTQFPNTTNLARQQQALLTENRQFIAYKNPTFLRKPTTDQSKIPVLLQRKSSDESLPIPGTSGTASKGATGHDEGSSNKDKRQTPKKFSFSVNQPHQQPQESNNAELKQHLGLGHLPVTTLTFNLGPHNMTYNGMTYTTSTAPTPLKSPGISSTNSTNAFSTSNGSRSSPGRNRKKVAGLGNISQTQGSNYFPQNSNYASINPNGISNNPRSLPLGVSVFGAPILKHDGNAWTTGTSGGNAESFLPRVTSKHHPPNVSFDENTPLPGLGSPSKPGTGVNPLGRKREKWDQTPQHTFQPRKVSISNSNDLGNIRPFLNSNSNTSERTDTITPLKGNLFKF